MFQKPSLLTRIAVGKLLGFVMVVVALIVFQGMLPDLSLQFQIALVLWYVTIGAFVGMMGVFEVYPLVNIKMPWWFRGVWIGGWMNFILVLLVPEKTALLMTQIFGEGSILNSHWWIVVDGAVFGIILDYFCTRIGGEGVQCVSKKAFLQE